MIYFSISPPRNVPYNEPVRCWALVVLGLMGIVSLSCPRRPLDPYAV